MPVPGRSYLMALFQEQTGDAGSFKASPHREPRRPCSYNNRMAMNGIVMRFVMVRYCAPP